MACYHPLTGWRSRYLNESGKRSIVFDRTKGYEDMEVQIPCGQCIGCRLDYSRQWAVRCVHEAQLHAASSFITLTFNEESLPEDRSISVRTLQLFFKRLRKAIYPIKIRYFACGEYGDITQRPHYHACIFGFDFPDKRPVGVNKQGDTLYSSPMLEKVWSYGFNWIGNVTFESCAYVARYMLKKQKGMDNNDIRETLDPETGEIYFQENTFAVMSRGGAMGGIGSKWFELYGESDTAKDFVTLRGRKMGLPKFYDMLLEKKNPNELEKRKGKRRYKAKKRADDNTPERLRDKEIIKTQKVDGLLKRDLE